jgi:hypothetical protein
VIIHAQTRHPESLDQLLVMLDCKFMLLKKCSGEIHPRTGHEGPEGGERHTCNPTISLTLALDWGA